MVEAVDQKVCRQSEIFLTYDVDSSSVSQIMYEVEKEILPLVIDTSLAQRRLERVVPVHFRRRISFPAR
jgi:hypothetical protein